MLVNERALVGTCAFSERSQGVESPQYDTEVAAENALVQQLAWHQLSYARKLCTESKEQTSKPLAISRIFNLSLLCVFLVYQIYT